MSRVSGISVVSTSWDPGSITDGSNASTDVSVPGAKMGDFVMHTHDVDVSDLTSTATVSSAGTVAIVLNNSSGGAVDLADHTVRVKVVPYENM